MPYSITTKDGITINNIPDDVAPDSPDLKARVARIRAGGGAAALEAPKAAPASQPMGFFESIGEMVTGSRRATPETQTLPEWTSMPELNQMSMASFKTALGTLLSNPKETVQILQANFPGSQIRKDAKGNYIIRSSVDQKEYAIPPGLSVGDIPRALGGLLAFTPAGRATTIPGAMAASAGTQALIETTQTGIPGVFGGALDVGGTFDAGEVGLAGATGALGPVVQRVGQKVMPAAKRAVQRVTGAKPAPVQAAQAAQAAPTAAATAAQAVPEQPIAQAAAQAIPEQPIAQAAAPVAAEAAETGISDVLNLARKAKGVGPGSTAAKTKLVELAQVNPEARAAAERLGVELPFDVLSDNPQVRSAVGLTRALVGSEAESAWEGTVRKAVERFDDVSKQFDAAFVEGRPAPGVTSQRILDTLQKTRDTLKTDARAIYENVDQMVPKSSPVELNNLQSYLDDLRTNLGPSGRMTAQEANLAKMLEKGELTYFGLKREKDLVGQAVGGLKSPYDNMAAGDLKRLYAALAQDQLDNVGALAGEETRRQLRAANLLTAQQKALEKRIVGAFGQDIDGSVAQRMQTAISTAAKGDAAAFNRLMKVIQTVPPELQKETVATALASVTAGKAAGRAAGAAEAVFSPSEFTKVYRGLRANPPVYAKMVSIMGSEWDRAARDMYELSRRIADAQARIPTTGKANQILGEAAVEGLVGKIMSSSLAQRAATGAASLVPGGGLVAPDIVQWMAATKGSGVQKAAKLFASPEFQELAVQAATQAGQPSEAAIRKVAMSKAFADFAKSSMIPQALDARIQWLQSAIQTSRQFQTEPQ